MKIILTKPNTYSYMYNSKEKSLYIPSNHDIKEAYEAWRYQYGETHNKDIGGIERILKRL